MGNALYQHYNSLEYRLEKVGYSVDEIEKISKLDKKAIDYALNNKYDKYLIPLTKQKYFLWKNYDEYVDYINKGYKNEVI